MRRREDTMLARRAESAQRRIFLLEGRISNGKGGYFRQIIRN